MGNPGQPMELVFVCYARQDAHFVSALTGKLKERGVPVWLDLWNIEPGSDWDQSIDAALHRCTHFLIVLSPTSVTSREVRGELRTALNENKSIVPVLYQPCDIPRQLQLIQYIDFTSSSVDDRDALERVVTVFEESRSVVAGEPKASAQQRTLMPSLFSRGTIARRVIIGLVPVILLGVVLTAKFAPDWSFGILRRSDDHVLIWKVGSPHRGDIPDATVPVDLQEAAQKLGLQIDMETYAAKGFALKFANAMKRKAEPDVLAFDNYGVLEGITTSLGFFEGIPVSDRKALITVSESLHSLEDENGGWEFLIATSHNFGKAKDLVLKKITCDESSAGLVKDEALLREITGPTLMASFAGAFGGNTGMAISSLLGQDSALRDSPKVNDIRICGVWGNRRLAFVNTAILFQGVTALGQRSSLVVLTRPGSSWELKLISRDVRIISKLSEQLPKLANDTDGAHLQPPSLRDPPDQARLPRSPERPVLEWDNSGLQTTAYLIESQFESRPAAWSGSAFELVLQRAARTIRVGAPFGVGMQPHRWRIWAIDKNGGTAISGWRTINYTN
jgi:TIR domain